MKFFKRNIATDELLGFIWWYIAFDLAVMVGFFLAGEMTFSVPLGLIGGSLFSALNFHLLGMAVEKSVKRESAKASSFMKRSYFLRYMLMAVVLFAGAKSGYFNIICLIIPLLYPRIILTFKYIRKGGNK
ncbi:MAG: hypothetical protein GX988_04220 [Clostridiales bacterium]|nr:hypothetical protein [Clostridiales bacterium]